MNTEVSFKLCLASSTILLGFTLRKLRVVTRENGESLLAVIFGALLPSLLLQVRFDAFFPYFCSLNVLRVMRGSRETKNDFTSESRVKQHPSLVLWELFVDFLSSFKRGERC